MSCIMWPILFQIYIQMVAGYPSGKFKLVDGEVNTVETGDCMVITIMAIDWRHPDVDKWAPH